MAIRQPAPPTALTWVAEACGDQVTGCTALVGGITADMDRVDLVSGRSVVLRRWTDPEDPPAELVARESAALSVLVGTEVPAPELLAADPDGSAAGVPATLTTFLPGRVELAPDDLDDWLTRLASAQATLHELAAPPSTQCPDGFDAARDRGWVTDPGVRRAAEDLAASMPEGHDPVFAHGDFQHFNVLWRDGAVSAVVDWPMAGTGPRALDVGHCRLNLAVLFSPDAADTFLRRYEAVSGSTVDPRGDVRALLGWDEEWPEFIPRQVAGRAVVDLDGMAGRVTETLRRAVARAG